MRVERQKKHVLAKGDLGNMVLLIKIESMLLQVGGNAEEEALPSRGIPGPEAAATDAPQHLYVSSAPCSQIGCCRVSVVT